MFIHPYTIKIVFQSLNCSKTAKDEPYFYHVENPDLSQLTQDQLDHIYSEGQEILEQISAETFKRMEKIE